MAAALGGLDVLAFSGGIGENRADVRAAVAERLAFAGAFRVEVVPAREELVIARAVRRLLAGRLSVTPRRPAAPRAPCTLARSSSGSSDRERAAEPGEHARRPVERACPHPQQRAVLRLDELGERRGKPRRRDLGRAGRAAPRPPTSTACARASG